MHQIDLFIKFPIEVQTELLGKMMLRAKDTVFGKKHDFSCVKTYTDFKEAVPLQDYSDVEPFVQRLMEGERDLLWPGEIKWFAKSSGTTNSRSKLIPVTKDSLEECHYKGGKDLLALYYHNLPHRKLYNGKHLIVGGSSEINHLKEDSYSGDLSAIILKNLPWWAEIRRTPARETALMSDWSAKIEKMAIETMREDVYIIAGVPSWTMLLISRVLELSGKSNLKEVWPNLELFMHGGVSFKPYRNYFEKIIPDINMNYVETYNASEGFFGIQDQLNSEELLLMLDYGIFYEFIPMTSFDGCNSVHTISLEDVELGCNYALVISTNGGLWRYILGDTIQFTTRNPYRFIISGRTKSYLNVFGEEVIVDNAEKAIEYACSNTASQIKEFTACPIFMSDKKQGAHEWLIEFVKDPVNLNEFIQKVDQKLREINSDYDAKRTDDLILKMPQLTSLQKGTFDRWLSLKDKLGGQNKIPRLMNNRELAEELTKINLVVP